MKKYGILFVVILLTGNLLAQNKIKVNCLKEESSITYAMTHPLHAWTGESKEINSPYFHQSMHARDGSSHR